MFIFIQILGFIGIAFNIISVQFNTHAKIMIMKTLGSLMFVIHYFLLGAFTGMVMDIIGMIRNIIFAECVRRGKPTYPWIVLFSVITVGAGVASIVMTWNATLQSMSRWTDSVTGMTVFALLISVLSVTAKFLTTVGYAIENPHKVRMMNLPSSICWLFYNFICLSLSGAANEVFVITSIIIAEIRFGKKARKNNNSQNIGIPETDGRSDTASVALHDTEAAADIYVIEKEFENKEK